MVRWSVRGVSLVAAVLLVLGLAGTAHAAPGAGGRDDVAGHRDTVGNDISWPQCGRDLPVGQAFGIVGVNNGLANTTNPCFAEQLAWAWTSTGTTAQPKAALYVNTANPGHAGTWWPSSNYYPSDSSTPVLNPYGECTGANDAACAYIYGYGKAYDNATIRGVPDPASYVWWLDVETMNTWQRDVAANRASLEGMAFYYAKVLGAAGVGVYSTTYQWRQIVGSVGPVVSGTVEPRPSILNGLPSWIAGATSFRGALRNCSSTPLTGGEVTVTQYVPGDLDYDVACP